MLRPSSPSLPLIACLFVAGCAVVPRPNLQLTDGRMAAHVVRLPYDAGRPETRKVYHHVLGPHGQLLTKGAGGKFGHHRGLFVGWNQTRWRGQTLDFWHMNGGESQQFAGYARPASLGMRNDAQVSRITWLAPDGTVVLRELRGLEVVAEGEHFFTLHLRVRLSAPNGDVELRGDPQHAGQQFRALQRFAEDASEPVRYRRATTAKPQGNDVWTDCEWIAAVLPLPEQPVTVLRVEGAANPGDAIWSTRGYGRFGAMRDADVTATRPLQLDQYYVIASGERDDDWCFAQSEFWRN